MAIINIKIEHCNSIETATVSLQSNALNIKYGPNGIGKSTIAKSIAFAVKADGSLQALKPFKYRSQAGHEPNVQGAESIKSALVFDDEYVSQFVFQRDEVLKNSFDIFIKNEGYIEAMSEIEILLQGIKSSFEGNENLTSAIKDLTEIRDAFGLTKAGAISKSSKGFKAFGLGNKVMNVPDTLLAFEAFIKSEKPASWITWQSKGNDFVDLSDNCPYCSSDISKPEQKDVARLVSTEYDAKAVEHLSILQAVIERLGKYFEETCRESLEKATKSKVELSPEEITFLANFRSEVETLIIKLEGLQRISFFSLRDVDKIDDEMAKLKIDLDYLPKLNSPASRLIVDPINVKLQELISKVGDLKEKIGKHKKQIERAIAENQDSINGFLRSAGYRYSVSIKTEAESYKMKLVHEDFPTHIETAGQHLSYGEKNAFALVLFMHQVLRENPDLVVLDDPVSSFDKTKKFAILNVLFRGKTSLRDCTVLMLTHDIEPAIDLIRIGTKRLFQHASPVAHFLTSSGGVVSEIEIKPEDIQTFSQICQTNVQSVDDDIIKCIYLRRHYEIINALELEYNLLANLLHGRDVPILKTAAGDMPMTQEQIDLANQSIKLWMPAFSYDTILSHLKDKEGMRSRFIASSIGYEKLQLFRVFNDLHAVVDAKEDSVLQKFVNEAFHIENEYVMQLNPQRFENIPEYVISECTRILTAA
jgi:energy-coupling factor transporter ATP-binding protein EcfA2